MRPGPHRLANARPLVLAALALCAACTGGDPASGAASCPPSARADDERADRILALLRTSDEGAALATAASDRVRAICFTPGSLSVVTTEHVLLLDARLSDAEAAARVGHLFLHERDGLPMSGSVSPETDCEARVHEALALEARAYAAEARLRQALGVTPPLVMPFEIEAETAPMPDAEASARWLDYLEAHPDGAPGIDALGSGYLAQCERERELAGR